MIPLDDFLGSLILPLPYYGRKSDVPCGPGRLKSYHIISKSVKEKISQIHAARVLTFLRFFESLVAH